jgi:cobaltochelatase CobN
MLAYQAMVDQMLVAVNKGYWKADPSTVAALEAANMEAIKEAGVACHAASCSSEKITKLAQEQDRQAQREAKSGFGLDALGAMVATLMPPAQAMPQPPAPPVQPPPDVVRGQEMREVKKEQRIEQLIWTYAWLIGLVVLGGMGYQAWRTRRESQLFSKP